MQSYLQKNRKEFRKKNNKISKIRFRIENVTNPTVPPLEKSRSTRGSKRSKATTKSKKIIPPRSNTEYRRVKRKKSTKKTKSRSKSEEKAGRSSWERSEVGVRSMPGERNASARKGQSRYRRWDASLSAVAADCASARVHARGTHTGRHAWKHQRWWNTPSRTGRAARKGRGKERERKCTLARVRASVDKSERRRAERAFLARLRDRQPGRLVASKPMLVREIEFRRDD